MFRTKKDVERHAQEVLRRYNNERERNRHCYDIARLFYNVRDFPSAKHYLALYTSVKDDSPLALKLQGQISEGLGDKLGALNAYSASLQYHTNQPDLVLKVCELLCETDVVMDSDRARYWCERGQEMFPYEPTIFRLKEKLVKFSGSQNAQAFENLINSEVKARPNDVNVRIKMMRLYLETGRSKAAFIHAVELEASQIFYNQLAWYECFDEVCKAYTDEFPSLVDWEVYYSWMLVLDRVATLSLSELTSSKKLIDCAQIVFRMDQLLFKASEVTVPKVQEEMYNRFIKHMTGQLCFHIACLILKRAKKDGSNWRDATRSATPILFLSLTPPPDSKVPWHQTLGANLKQTVSRWISDAYYRVSQAGYTLLVIAKDPEKVISHAATNNWREKIFQKVFSVFNVSTVNVTSSHFVMNDLLTKVAVRLPTPNFSFLLTRHLVPEYEKVRESLHHLVWLGLETTKHNHNKIHPDFHTYSFSKLRFSFHTLSNTSCETLSVLDVDAFLYAAVLCAAASLEEHAKKGFYSSDRPVTLPADISNFTCTHEQMTWWLRARQMNSQQLVGNNNVAEIRHQLRRGLEVVRVEGNHGLDVLLLVNLARTFADRAASMTKKSRDQTALDDRASLYWNTALPVLEKMGKNLPGLTCKSKLFDYPRKELSMSDVSSLLEEGRFFVACQLMKAEEYERAVEAFKPLRSPHASFNQALIYKKMAAAELEDRPKEEITSEMRSRHVILLTRARDSLCLTQERLRGEQDHPLVPALAQHMSEVDSALSRIEPDPDMVNRSTELIMSEPSLSSMGSPAAGDTSPFIHSAQPKLNGRHSTPHRHISSRHMDIKRQNNGDFVDVTQLLQVQALHDEIKKLHEKLDEMNKTNDKFKEMFEISENFKDMSKLNEKIEIIFEIVNELRRDVNKFKHPVGADDLYIFGDEEEYPEDVLSGQYQPSFVSSYPTPTQTAATYYPRGVQGTSTVTYGAPPPSQHIPLIPLASYQPAPFYNQPPLPFTDSQHLPDFLRPSLPKVVLPPQPPVNVVITTSDTLPTGPLPPQPTLSVTIPPQHRLGGLPADATPPHKFQIAMPPSVIKLDKSPIVVPDEIESEDDNEVGYDPCPNFLPIIPLPNEVNVMTGEEDDDILFENKAKLFRFVDREWKERGVGVVKILKNRMTDKVRLVMRRDQVHKVCANHLLRSDMELSWLKDSNLALIWGANDYAEEVVHLEKFCIKFKLPEEASKFRDVFNDAKTKYGQSPQKPREGKESKQSIVTSAITLSTLETRPTDSKVNLGGFTFTSPPKLKETTIEKEHKKEEPTKQTHVAPSPFAGFTFSQKPVEISKPSPTHPNVMKQMTSTSSLFAGLNNTQNKHSLFKENMVEVSPHTTVLARDSLSKDVTETSPKTILKEPVLQSIPQSISSTVSPSGNKIMSTPKLALNEANISQPKSLFSFTSQGTPKSILKETPVSSSNITLTASVKTSPATKHVLFQDTSSLTLSQQTPTLATLLTTQTPVLDFAALSKINENKSQAFSSDNKSSGFEGAGTAVFGNSTQRLRNDSEGENAEEFVPSAEFKPVVPLPELIEVRTGEEGLEVLFDEKAKLLRFDSSSKEWKERGVGQMKILKDPRTKVTKFLMRRDQVFKVCCNHLITSSIEVKPMPFSEKAWRWLAVDSSDSEPKNECFAVRFKTIELAKMFKQVVDNVQKQCEKVKDESGSKRSCPDSTPLENEKSQSVRETSMSPKKIDAGDLPPLSTMFRPKAGTWECKGCYTRNEGKDHNCVSCDSPKEKVKSPAPAPITPPTSSVSSGQIKTSLVDMFRPKAGSWECECCMIKNEANKIICSACSMPKPGQEGEAKETQKSSMSFGFSFGIQPTGTQETGFSFGIKPNENISKSSFQFGVTEEKKSSVASSLVTSSAPNIQSINESHLSLGSVGTGFTFGQSSQDSSSFSFTPMTNIISSSADSTTTASSIEPTKSSTPFKFGGFGDASISTPSKTSFSFGGNTPNTTSLSGGQQFAFGQEGKFEFSFSGVRAARSPNKSPRSPSTGRDSDSEPDQLDDEDGDHLVFQPVVPLPDKVPVSTGEEDEEVIYSHRAKLYRFSAGEWKERGTGDIKILRHNNTHKIRVLMRREPILKICCNHLLTPEMSLKAKDDRSWLWCAADFADGHLQNEQFCVRFITPEVSAEFKAAFQSAQEELRGAKRADVEAVALSNTHGDVEIVYEASVSEELRQAALRLQLPPNFYSYLNAPPCPGCPGCDTEDEDTLDPQPTVPTSRSSAVTTTTSAPVVSLPVTVTTATTLSLASTTSSSQGFSFTFNPTTFATQTAAVSRTPLLGVETTESSLSGVPTDVSFPSQATVTMTQPFSFSLKNTVVSTSTTVTRASQINSILEKTTPLPSATAVTVSQPFTFNVNPTMAATTTPSVFSFTLNADVATTTSGSSLPVFGTNSFFSGSPFLQTTTANKFGSTLGQSSENKTQSLLFGSTPSTQSTTTLSFGNSQNATPTIFGGSALNQSTKTTPVLSVSSVESSASSFFGGTNQSPASVFGTPKTSCDSSTTTGSSFFQNLTSFETPQKSFFGGMSPQSSASFSNSPAQPASTDSGPTFLFKDTTSFSDIATKSKPTAFGSGSSNFSWEGAGSTVFEGKEDKPRQKVDSDGEGESEGEADNSHDPVFEPIVPLPDAIEVRTGEEDEEKEFCERAKFFRFDMDTKQWKERGIGEMKILRHKKANTYRLLLRREQVYKVVCNQLILPNLELQPLTGSDSAFCWAAMNMAEEYSEPQLEKVAVRFSNSDLAHKFKDTLEKCIADIMERKQSANTSVAESESDITADYSVLEPESTLEEREDSEFDPEFDPDPMFEKRAKLYVKEPDSDSWTSVGQGEISIHFNGIIMFKADNGQPFKMCVGSESNVQEVGEKEVSWSGQNFAAEEAEEVQDYKAEFCSMEAANEFTSVFIEMVEMSLNLGYTGSDAED